MAAQHAAAAAVRNGAARAMKPSADTTVTVSASDAVLQDSPNIDKPSDDLEIPDSQQSNGRLFFCCLNIYQLLKRTLFFISSFNNLAVAFIYLATSAECDGPIKSA